MNIQAHLGKLVRIERSGGKLNRDGDYELFVETYMLAGTHLLNAVLHGSGITREQDDLLHSDKPPLDKPVPPEISEMMRKLKQIEDMRSGYLRGKTVWQPKHGHLCFDNMQFLRTTTRQLLHDEEVKPVTTIDVAPGRTIATASSSDPALPSNHCTALAAFVCELDYSDIPEDVIEKEKIHLLDGLGNGLCGAASDFGQMVVRYLKQVPSKAEAVVWGSSLKANCAQAAFANGSFSNYGEMEDAHFRTKFKPNTVLTPAAIAVAEHTGASARDVLTAVIAANEACLRIATATHVGSDGYARGWIGTSSIGAFGAAIITGRLLNFDVARMAHAISLAGAQPCGIWSGGMAMSKRVLIGKAAENGILSAYMADEGITGGFDIFDGDWGAIGSIISTKYDPDIITKDFGSYWFTREVGLECYPTKGGAHSAIDCVLDILSRGPVNPADIDSILVRATTGIAKNRALSLFPPRDFYEAQNSLPYILAVTLFDGACGLPQFTDEKIVDPDILALARKIKLVPDAEADKLSPKTKTTFVDITLRNGQVLTSRVDYCKGEPENFLTREEIRKKFKTAAAGVLPDSRLDEIIGAAERLETLKDLRGFTKLLAAG